ncbi:MAG: DUF808 domain-containing protein, partial [Pseudomonadota bacterium]
WHGPEDTIYGAGKAVGTALNSGFADWLTKAAIDGVLGLGLGMLLIPVGERVVTPVWRAGARLFP